MRTSRSTRWLHWVCPRDPNQRHHLAWKISLGVHRSARASRRRESFPRGLPRQRRSRVDAVHPLRRYLRYPRTTIRSIPTSSTSPRNPRLRQPRHGGHRHRPRARNSARQQQTRRHHPAKRRRSKRRNDPRSPLRSARRHLLQSRHRNRRLPQCPRPLHAPHLLGLPRSSNRLPPHAQQYHRRLRRRGQPRRHRPLRLLPGDSTSRRFWRRPVSRECR